jgi:hypothetical protein
MQNTRLQMDQEQQKFDRKLKMAELHGKLASQRGEAAPKQGDFRLDEAAGLSHGFETERVPTMAREERAKYGYREFGKDNRAFSNIQAREKINQDKISFEGTRLQDRARHNAARLALDELKFQEQMSMNAAEKAMLKARRAQIGHEIGQDTARIGTAMMNMYQRAASSMVDKMYGTPTEEGRNAMMKAERIAYHLSRIGSDEETDASIYGDMEKEGLFNMDEAPSNAPSMGGVKGLFTP